MRPVRLLPAIALLCACTTLQPVSSPVAYLERNNPEAVRIYTAPGQLTVVQAPRLEGNTISGFDAVEGEDVAISVDGIRRMEVKQFDRTRTTLFVGAVTLLAGAGVYMATQGGGDRSLICDGYELGNRCREAALVVRLPLLRLQ